jgi:tripartite-type tricarboxylate transporter receptor subunit TctC
MTHWRRRITRASRGVALLSVAIIAGVTPASSQSIAEHFAGKSVRIIVPSLPGGDRGLYPTVFAPFFAKHIPGNPKVVPVFMPGAGGSTGVNYIYNVAPPDGLTLVTPLVAVVTAQAVGEESVKYDVRKLNWVGRITGATRVLMVSAKIPAKTLPELQGQEVIIAAGGRTSETYLMPAFMNYLLGTKFKIVLGYEAAGKRNMAVINGEVDASITTSNDVRHFHADRIKEGGTLRLIVQVAWKRDHSLPNLPLLLDYAKDQADRDVIEFMSAGSQMGQPYATSPGTPAPVVDALRRAFDATMKDPAFLAKMQQADMDFDPATGEELTEIVTKTIAAPKSVVDRYIAAIRGDAKR